MVDAQLVSRGNIITHSLSNVNYHPPNDTQWLMRLKLWALLETATVPSQQTVKHRRAVVVVLGVILGWHEIPGCIYCSQQSGRKRVIEEKHQTNQSKMVGWTSSSSFTNGRAALRPFERTSGGRLALALMNQHGYAQRLKVFGLLELT